MGVTTREFKEAVRAIGSEWNDATLSMLRNAVLQEFKLAADVPGGFAEYRTAMTASFLTKFFFESRSALLAHEAIDLEDIFDDEFSPAHDYKFEQDYPEPPGQGQYLKKVVGKDHKQNSAKKHVTGKTTYIDDLPYTVDECFAAPILSEKPHARIKSIDYSAALAVDGVVGTCDINDVPGSNDIMQMWQKEHCNKVFYSDIVTSTGQVIAVVIGKNKRAAQKGAGLVKVEYEELQPVILTLSDAIKHDTHVKPSFECKNGNLEKGFGDADHVIEGILKIGGQEHFYFEPQW